MEFKLTPDGGSPVTMITNENISSWWNRNQTGFTLLRYVVPDDLPKYSNISGEFRVIEITRQAEEEFGQLDIYIRKDSEK